MIIDNLFKRLSPNNKMTKNLEYCECLKCGHEWLPRKKNPLMCPRCKNYYWDCEDEDD